ncbi:hypothetical protein Q4F19_16845 [Sphingomonas sp. BIUV-7]|uniref:Uncharacterized protein n=1 Tax=Sphingomonas natans TaxID=3063330 RepID=A0ABT8YCL2_9SPHN|nr:hypothetical protein [Sphingomonas sp. BIUV-7]MDO6416059.1 hypothetical protein [Sphingomonas sp. BIUV-7]
MNQVAAHKPVFDRVITHVTRDLDRAPGFASPASAPKDPDGLFRALAFAVPVSALLWMSGVAIAVTALR